MRPPRWPDGDAAESRILRAMDNDKRPAVHEQVLVEAEVDGAVIRFRAIIANVRPTTIWLGLLKPDSQLERLVAGDPVHLTFRRDNAAMIAASTFLSHLGSSRTRLFSIEWPNDIRMIQRRTQLRLDADCPIQYTVISHSASVSAGSVGRGVTRNISAGGLLFKEDGPVEEAIAVGEEIEARITLSSDVVVAGAEVIRVEDGAEIGLDGLPKLKPGPPKPPSRLIAVRFVSIPIMAEDRIIRYIFSLQRMRRDAARRHR